MSYSNGNRFRMGNAPKNAKLTAMDVLTIRKRYAAGESQSSLSREYRISVGQMGRIVRHEVWQHVSGPGVEDTTQAQDIRAAQYHAQAGTDLAAAPPSQMSPEVQRSLERLQRMLAEPQPVVADPFATSIEQEPTGQGLEKLMRSAGVLASEQEQLSAAQERRERVGKEFDDFCKQDDSTDTNTGDSHHED